jgi:recombinational DNA repair protein (RecF pathway)
VSVLDQIAVASPTQTVEAGLAGAWRMVSVLGFTPELSSCALCHSPLRDADDAIFSHGSGGVICVACNRLVPGGRKIPASARALIGRWLEGDAPATLSEADARSHQRLLREFLGHHLTDDRPLRAFAVWEHERWSAA